MGRQQSRFAYELYEQARYGKRHVRDWLRTWLALNPPAPGDMTGAYIGLFQRSDHSFYSPDFSGLDFSNRDLTGAAFCEDLRGTNFDRAILRDVEASNIDLSDSSFVGADLSGAHLSDVSLCRCDLRSALLRRTRLFGSNLTEANLRQASLVDATIQRTVLDGADLTEADLRGATLLDTDLLTTRVTGADFRRAAFVRTRMSDWSRSTDISGARFDQPLTGLYDDRNLVNPAVALVSTTGFEAARFDTPGFHDEVVRAAFDYLHRQDTPESRKWPAFTQKAIARIKALQRLYTAPDNPGEIVKVAQIISAELIAHLARHPRELYDLRPRQFEALIAEILKSFGWAVDLTAATRDGGYDIFAVSKDSSGLSTSWVVECKKYRENRTVGIDVIRGIYTVKSELRAANALLATTSHFSRDVNAFKASRYDLQLRDFEGIVEWLQQISIAAGARSSAG